MRTARPNSENRLTHDLDAHIRANQISERVTFAYCEGRDLDPFVYGDILTEAHSVSGKSFSLHRIENVTGTGGKNALLSLFKIYDERGLLVNNFKGKHSVSIFFLDKDLDDLRRSKVKSIHIFYTEMYNLECHLYSESDLHRAIAAGLSVSPNVVPEKYKLSSLWLEGHAKNWEAWIKLCLYTTLYGADCGCGYKRPSVINQDSIGATDAHAFLQFKSQLKESTTPSDSVFAKRWLRVEKIFKDHESRGLLRRIFNGKWLEGILLAEMRALFDRHDVNFKSAGSKITATLMASGNFSVSWRGRYLRQIRGLLLLIVLMSSNPDEA